MFYEAVFDALNKAKIRYLVVGGLAVNLHGVPRVTQDLDILPEMSDENLKRLVSALQNLGFRARAPVRAEGMADPKLRKKWVKEKNMTAFSFYRPGGTVQEIDVLVVSPVSYARAAKTRVLKRAGKLKIPLISISNLITMKKASNRSVDLWDVDMLRCLNKKGKAT